MSAIEQAFDEGRIVRRAEPKTAAAVILAVLVYPFVLDAFHWAVGASSTTLAGLALLASFAVPIICLLLAIRMASRPIADLRQQKVLRLCYFGVVAPTAYVFMGVLLYMAGGPVADEWVWAVVWLIVAAWAFAPAKPAAAVAVTPAQPSAGLRVAHGIAATVLLVYVLFHLTNHLFGLAGPEAHAAVMKLGRRVYRAPLVEPLLVAVFLFQVGSGLALAWRWSARSVEPFRVFQIASGLYLSLFVLGHMNSVFFFARTYLGIDTGWGFATGAPTGIINDPWNIRLLPHYWLGAFLVLSHLVTGLRVVLSAHGASRAMVSRVWSAGLVGSAAIASFILAGMCGLRL